MMLTYLCRALAHLRNGTLLDRLQSEWIQYIKRKRLARWESQARKREHFEITIEGDVRIRLYSDSRLSQLIYCGGFEWRERQFLNDFLSHGDVFVDIGANIGLYTLLAAHRVGKAGRVYAFEPCHKTYQRLLTNVKLNRLTNVSCYQLALSDAPGEHHMTVSLDGFDACNSLARPLRGQSFAVETVNCVTWDDFAREHGLVGQVTMMKIDVEGWEARVLLGGRKSLSRPDAPILQVEFTDQAALNAGSSCAYLYQLLEELGYQMHIYDTKSKRLILDPFRQHYPYVNLIAAKRTEEVNERLKHRFSLFHLVLRHKLW